MNKDDLGKLGNALGVATHGVFSITNQLSGEVLISNAQVVGMETGEHLGTPIGKLSTLITLRVDH